MSMCSFARPVFFFFFLRDKLRVRGKNKYQRTALDTGIHSDRARLIGWLFVVSQTFILIVFVFDSSSFDIIDRCPQIEDEFIGEMKRTNLRLIYGHGEITGIRLVFGQIPDLLG